MQKNPILILDTENGLNKLKIEYLSEDTAGVSLNGESVYHIFHVKMLTEYLLHEYMAYNPDLMFSEDDINAIAIASSLHDIGKLQIPKSILEHPGTLSPVEYDIVKKHSVFGEQTIRSADPGEVDDKIVKYAAEIARFHHERVDGTGYPDGLRGKDIPISAQAVALADSYDALTSSRSYKQAFSQDVALQMISSGMCGVFDEGLVECLMRVVNHQAIVAFRDNLQKRGSVIESYQDISIKRVLMIGNTEYLTDKFVKDTFPQSKVMVVGNTELGSSDKIKLFRVRKPSVKAILETYEFDLIVFFSRGLSFHSKERNDAEELREVLKYSAKLQKNVKILYFSPLDSGFREKTDKAIMTTANERLCEFYSKKHSLDIKTVQIPYLYSGTYKKDFLYGVFEAIYNKKTIKIPEAPTTKMHFISLADLSELFARIVGNWKSGGGILSVGDEFRITFDDLIEKLSSIEPSLKVDFIGDHDSGELQTLNTVLRSEYGWFAKISILEDLPEQYEKYLATKKAEAASAWERFKNWFASRSLVIKILELLVLFLVSELFIHITDSAVIFSIVDFRTIFIVIMALLYGMPFGIAAAGLSSISYFIAKVSMGTNALTIFYEPTNWLAFVFFFLVGGLCGYVHLKNHDQCQTLTEQNKLMENKLIFVNEIYEDTLKDKKELKKQIISSKDSFGKIFDITRRLNTVEPQQLYLKIIDTFEEILENKSFTVYSVRPGTRFGRLEVSSRDLLDVAARSISMEAYAPVLEQMKNGGIWKNTELNGEYPMYAAGVYRGDELMLMIFIWHAGIDQRSLYYVNLFKILRDLAQMSLLRAYDYSIALLEKQYIENTRIMNADYFEEYVKNFNALAERKISYHTILAFDLKGHTLREADAMLAGKIRTTDILGVTMDGELRLILSQATQKDLAFILPRFEELDISVTVLE